MKTIADELVAALAGIPECFYQLNPKPAAEIVYPYAVFGFSYMPTADQPRGTYTVTLEIDLFDRGPNALRLLNTEETVVDSLGHYRAMRPAAWSMATLDQALDVPTLVDGLHRRHLQFDIRMTLREKG